MALRLNLLDANDRWYQLYDDIWLKKDASGAFFVAELTRLLIYPLLSDREIKNVDMIQGWYFMVEFVEGQAWCSVVKQDNQYHLKQWLHFTSDSLFWACSLNDQYIAILNNDELAIFVSPREQWAPTLLAYGKELDNFILTAIEDWLRPECQSDILTLSEDYIRSYRSPLISNNTYNRIRNYISSLDMKKLIIKQLQVHRIDNDLYITIANDILFKHPLLNVLRRFNSRHLIIKLQPDVSYSLAEIELGKIIRALNEDYSFRPPVIKDVVQIPLHNKYLLHLTNIYREPVDEFIYMTMIGLEKYGYHHVFRPAHNDHIYRLQINVSNLLHETDDGSLGHQFIQYVQLAFDDAFQILAMDKFDLLRGKQHRAVIDSYNLIKINWQDAQVETVSLLAPQEQKFFRRRINLLQYSLALHQVRHTKSGLLLISNDQNSNSIERVYSWSLFKFNFLPFLLQDKAEPIKTSIQSLLVRDVPPEIVEQIISYAI